MIVKLVVHGGKNEGAVIAINKSPFIIGRLPECNLRIESKALSRRHAQIDVSDGSVTVKDLGSTNGTFVDGKKITEPVELKNGQSLRVGPLETTVQISAEMHGAKNPKVASVKEAVNRVANSKQNAAADDGEIDLSALFGEDGEEAGEEFQKTLTTVVNWNTHQEQTEQKKNENVNHAADSREAASKTLEAMFKSMK
ncbi:MAG: FHA domain-containing protein [Thermoguttaceae bacterium]|nr:FHA domain-containing protein [Thermoguttaceae bacterium]